MKKITKIKKCSYWMCGKNPKIKKFSSGNYEIICFGCGHNFVEFGKTKKEAIKRWNNRMK